MVFGETFHFLLPHDFELTFTLDKLIVMKIGLIIGGRGGGTEIISGFIPNFFPHHFACCEWYILLNNVQG
jgi:hypothetical protein